MIRNLTCNFLFHRLYPKFNRRRSENAKKTYYFVFITFTLIAFFKVPGFAVPAYEIEIRELEKQIHEVTGKKRAKHLERLVDLYDTRPPKKSNCVL